MRRHKANPNYSTSRRHKDITVGPAKVEHRIYEDGHGEVWTVNQRGQSLKTKSYGEAWQFRPGSLIRQMYEFRDELKRGR